MMRIQRNVWYVEFCQRTHFNFEMEIADEGDVNIIGRVSPLSIMVLPKWKVKKSYEEQCKRDNT